MDGTIRTPTDSTLPVLGALLEDGAGLLAAVGRTVEGEVRPVQVHWRPGKSVAVRYVERVTAPGAIPADFVAYAARELPEGVAVLEGEHGRVAVWGIQDDPWLPGLRLVLSPDRVRELLAGIGVAPAPVALRLRAYRPGRRAVVEVRTGGRRLFLKVVRPGRIAALQRRHRVMEGALPVPGSHGWSSQLGLVVLEARPGVMLREAIGRDDVPSPASIARLIEAMPDIGDGRPARSQVLAGQAHLDLLRRLAPEASACLDGFDVAAVEDEALPWRPIHGDLHEAQLLVEGGAITGLLDVDTAGLGDPRDDWATLLGHLLVRAHEVEADRATRDYARRVASHVLASIPSSSVRGFEVRTAAVLVGLASGPFAAQVDDWPRLVDRRVQLAGAWWTGNGLRVLLAGHENDLSEVSSLAHLAP